MNQHTETLDGAYIVVTTRATGRVRLQLGHALFMPIDKTEMSAQQARDVAQALIQAAVLLDLNAGAGGRVPVNPQRMGQTINSQYSSTQSGPQGGRVNWGLMLVLSATVVGWASIVKVGGHRLGWW